MNGRHRPRLAIVTGSHITRDTLTLGHSVDIARVSTVQDNLGIRPGCTH